MKLRDVARRINESLDEWLEPIGIAGLGLMWIFVLIIAPMMTLLAYPEGFRETMREDATAEFPVWSEEPRVELVAVDGSTFEVRVPGLDETVKIDSYRFERNGQLCTIYEPRNSPAYFVNRMSCERLL